MFAPSKTMWRDHGNKFPQRPSSAQPRLSRPRPPVVVVKGLPQGGPGPALDTERLVYSPRSDRSASPRGRPASAARARPASARTSRERRAPKPKAVDWRVSTPDDVAPVRRVDFELKLRDGYDGPPPRARPRPAAVARREAERAACAAPAAPEDEPADDRGDDRAGDDYAGLAVSMMRGEDIVGAYASALGGDAPASAGGRTARQRASDDERLGPAAGPRAGSPRRDARKETWEPERLERTILARVEERAARSLSGYRYLRCAMFLRSFFGDGVDAVAAGQFGALLRAKLGIHVEDADVVRLWVQRFGAKSGEHRLATVRPKQRRPRRRVVCGRGALAGLAR